MHLRPAWNVLVVLLLAGTAHVFVAPDALAQDLEVGIVARIKDHRKDVSSTTRAQLWRVGQGGPVSKELPLRDQDILRLGQQIFLDLGFFGDEFESRVILGTRSLATSGSYEIRDNTVDEIGGLELVVRQGVMVVQHVRGRLTTVAAGVRTRVFGTTIMVSADEDGREAHFYLPEGTIGFLEWPDLARLDAGTEGRAWRLREGQRPEEVDITADMRQRWRDEVRYNTSSVWRSTPFWQRPQFYIPAGIVVAGGAILLLTSRGSDRVGGYVIATIPGPP